MRASVRLADRLKPALSRRTRRKIVMRRLGLRGYTSSIRCLPDFLVIGTERGGTSSLYKYLGRHPEIAPSLRKETEFFNRHYGQELGWYRAHFPLELRRKAVQSVGRRLFSFEATPTYLQDPRVPERVAATLPHARFIVLLRNPIARAVSGWKHMTEGGFESLSFDEAVATESERIRGELERMLRDPLYFSRSYHRFSYIDRGHYAEQLTRWFQHFPSERFLVIESEDFYRDTEAVYRQMLEFIGVREWVPDEFRMYSSATSADPSRVADELEPDIRVMLEKHYAPHNRKLVDLVGRRFSWA